MSNNIDNTVDKEAFIAFVTGLADDSMVLGQRLSAWCSRGPYMEEDLALTNTTLDYIGRASLFYQYAAELIGGDTTEDTLAFKRDERQYTNLLINEIPNGDFAFTMARQYLLDVYYSLYLAELQKSNDETVAAIADKAVKETTYHLKRSRQWMKQLALGTDESLARLNKALEEIQDYCNELFLNSEADSVLIDAGISVDRPVLRDAWVNQVNTLFSDIKLAELDLARTIEGGRVGIHTEHLGHLLVEMQYLQRAFPDLEW